MQNELQRFTEPHATLEGKLVVLAVEGDGLLACHHAAKDLDPFARARERFRVRLAVPTLHNLWPRDTDAELEATVR